MFKNGLAAAATDSQQLHEKKKGWSAFREAAKSEKGLSDQMAVGPRHQTKPSLGCKSKGGGLACGRTNTDQCIESGKRT